MAPTTPSSIANAVASSTRMGTCCARSCDPNISFVSSTASSLVIWLAFLFPAAQVVRLLDQIAAAIDPRLSLVGSLHSLLVASPSGTLVILVAIVFAGWIVRRAGRGTSAAASAFSG